MLGMRQEAHRTHDLSAMASSTLVASSTNWSTSRSSAPFEMSSYTVYEGMSGGRTKLGSTYQDPQELTSPVLIISDFHGGSGKRLVLVSEVGDNDSGEIRHHWDIGFFLGHWKLVGRWEKKKKNCKRLHTAIIPYIAENLLPYVM